MKKFFFILFSIYFIITTNTLGKENEYFLSLKNNKVNVRQGPDKKYPVKFIYKKKFLPIKIIDKHYNFRKFIDLYNNSGWIHISQLSKKKTAINIKKNSIMFKKPKIYSKPIATIESGKLVLIKKCLKLWCKISANQFIGWIKKEQLWGKVN